MNRRNSDKPVLNTILEDLRKEARNFNNLTKEQHNSLKELIKEKPITKKEKDNLNQTLDALYGANQKSNISRQLGDGDDKKVVSLRKWYYTFIALGHLSPFEIDSVLAGKKDTQKNYVISIVGPSCSGKSTIANLIKETLGLDKVVVLGLDRFYREESVVHKLIHRFDNPAAIDFDLAYYALKKLIWGQKAKVPVYDKKTGKVTKTEELEPRRLIIVEGIFAQNDFRCNSTYLAKVYLDCSPGTRLLRRIKRDTDPKGKDQKIADLTHQYINDVEIAYEKFLRPEKVKADIVIHNQQVANISNLDVPIGIRILLDFLLNKIFA